MRKMWRYKFKVESLKFKLESLLKLGIKSKEHRRKRSLYVLLFTLNFLLISLLISCQNKNKIESKVEANTKYTCSMHPQIIEDKPGSCPICGMDLVIKHSQALKMDVDTSLSNVIKATNETVLSNINTLKVDEDIIADTLLLNGKVVYDTNNLKTISSRVSGRIEKLFVKYNFQKVVKGQKLMEIYSPELAAAQQELLYLKANGDHDLLEQAKSKLRLLGISESQILQTLQTGKVNYRIPIYSNASGYLIDANASKINGEMDAKNLESINTESSAISILEGQYLKTGDMLFKLFNDNEVWAEFYANTNEITSIKKNQAITISTKSNLLQANIDLIQPYFKEGQSYSVVRVNISNSKQKFKIGEILKAEIFLIPLKGLWLPKEAVYKLGNKNIVFLKQNNALIAKEVTIIRTSKSKILIGKGLQKGDEIASNASYLIDTESFIKI
jgi:Cu(I)/Ag(I) efflux system membrane fusion protein